MVVDSRDSGIGPVGNTTTAHVPRFPADSRRDGAMMLSNNALDDCKSETGAFGPRRVEGLEQLVFLFCINPATVITDLDANPWPIRSQLQVGGYVDIRRAILDALGGLHGIDEKVGKHLTQLVAVAVQSRQS